jgi:hypothetical protein
MYRNNSSNEKRSSVSLTERLLSEIQDSISVFRPSKSLSMLSNLAHEESPAAEIDVVISGGGMRYFN